MSLLTITVMSQYVHLLITTSLTALTVICVAMLSFVMPLILTAVTLKIVTFFGTISTVQTRFAMLTSYRARSPLDHRHWDVLLHFGWPLTRPLKVKKISMSSRIKMTIRIVMIRFTVILMAIYITMIRSTTQILTIIAIVLITMSMTTVTYVQILMIPTVLNQIISARSSPF